MTSRPLMAHERALIAAAVVFSAAPAVSADGFGKTDLFRLASICDGVRDLPSVDRFQVEHGPVTDIYWAATELIQAYRDSSVDRMAKDRLARLLAASVFCYFEQRCVSGLKGLGLKHQMAAPVEKGASDAA